MRYLAIVATMILGVSASPAPAADDADLSCTELAERRAAQQYVEEDAARMDRQAGQVRDSALQRDLLRLDAESYRDKVYRDCLRLRGLPEGEPEPARPDR